LFIEAGDGMNPVLLMEKSRTKAHQLMIEAVRFFRYCFTGNNKRKALFRITNMANSYQCAPARFKAVTEGNMTKER
jgi:hypothetical protein